MVDILKQPETPERLNTVPAVSGVFDNGVILETVHNPEERSTRFAVWQDGQWTYSTSFALGDTLRLVPYSPDNNLIKNEAVLLPSAPEEYGSEEQLLYEIETFVHRYVDLSPLFRKIASYYVLLSWVYDGFNELPYLRVRGDPGSGKTRFLLTVGSLCYKPIFASGASTVSPLFRILDAFRGTLIIDEGDFRMSDERAEVVKILNNGNAKGFPVLRSEVSNNGREYNPRAYSVFGPKLVATRGYFQDRALESRFLTEEMGQVRLRDDVPISLPSQQRTEACQLRNKLLLFRFRHLHKVGASEELVDRSIEPRISQIFVPLLSIIRDEDAREQLREVARQYSREIVAERGMDMEAQILEIIRGMADSPDKTSLSIKEITSRFIERHEGDYDRKITAKWIGTIVRRRLNLRPQKSHGVYVIPPSERSKLDRLYEKYAVASGNESGTPQTDLEDHDPFVDRVDVGDVGDVPEQSIEVGA